MNFAGNLTFAWWGMIAAVYGLLTTASLVLFIGGGLSFASACGECLFFNSNYAAWLSYIAFESRNEFFGFSSWGDSIISITYLLQFGPSRIYVSWRLTGPWNSLGHRKEGGPWNQERCVYKCRKEMESICPAHPRTKKSSWSMISVGSVEVLCEDLEPAFVRAELLKCHGARWAHW